MMRSSRSGLLPVAMMVAVGLLAIGIAYVLMREGRLGCVHLEVNVSTEKGDLLAELAEDYHDAGRLFDYRHDGREISGCADVRVNKTTSGAAKSALAAGWDEERDGAPEPQVWLPTSSIWLDLLVAESVAGDRTITPVVEPVSIAQSPLVIAMPRPKAEALGWPEAKIGWRDLYELTTDEEGWGSVGYPQWGPFSLGKDNPTISTSGLAATVASYYAATGLSSDLSPGRVSEPETMEFVRGIEAGVLHYADDAVRYMANLAEADRDGQAMSYLSAIAVQEQMVYLYNQGSPTGDPELIGEGRKPEVPLVAIPPADGTLMLDHPYIVLPSVTVAQRAAAADFLEFLELDEQQKAFTDLGFRDHEGGIPGRTAEVISAPAGQVPGLIEPPSPRTLAAIVDGWHDVRRRANVLLVMDVSGSMLDPAGGGQNKIEAAKEAAIGALGRLHPDDALSLWSFSTERGDARRPYTEHLPLTPVGAGRERIVGAIKGLHADGGTALYHTIRAAHRAMAAWLDPDRINAIVVLSDGKNEYPRDDDLDALLRGIDAADLERSVRVFPVAFGDRADLETLEAIAAASRGSAYDARDPATIDKVFISVLSNF